MIAPGPGTPATGGNAEETVAPPERQLPPTPWRIRAALAVLVLIAGGAAYLLHGVFGYRIQAAAGILCFLGIPAALSQNLRAVNPRTLAWGIALIVIIAAEMIGGVAGLGYMVLTAQQTFRVDRVFAGIVTIGVLGFATDQGLRALRRKLLPWYQELRE